MTTPKGEIITTKSQEGIGSIGQVSSSETAKVYSAIIGVQQIVARLNTSKIGSDVETKNSK